VSLSVERADGFSLGSPPREGARLYAEDLGLAPAAAPPTRWGFRFEKETAALTYDHTAATPPLRTTWTATAPHWFLVVIAAVLPAARLLSPRRSGRRRPGLCPRCGYDLTGDVSGACPECGSVSGQARA
jgi:hypothetical protein